MNWNCLAATAALVLGDIDAAHERMRDAARLSEGLDHDIIADVRMTSGDVAVAQGRLEQAAQRYRAAVDVLREVPPRRGLVAHWRDLGDRFRELDDQRSAAECYERALTTARVADRSAELRRRIFAHDS